MKQTFARRAARIALSLMAGCAAMAFGGVARAEYPERPIRVVIGFPAGGGADILARWYVDKVREISGATIVLENKPGASGNIASDAVAKSKPDGYTLMLSNTSGLVGNIFIYKNLPFDTLKDFQPITGLLSLGFAFTVAADSPAKSIADLSALLKSKGPRATFGWATSTGLAGGSLYLKMADIKATTVTYKTNANAVSDVAAGQIDFCVSDMTYTLGQEKQGKVRILAITSDQRSASAPAVPTLAEAGFPTASVTPYWAVYTPAGVPRDIADKIAKWFDQVSAMPETKAFLLTQAADGWKADAAAVQKKMDDSFAQWRQVATLVNLEPQ